MKTTKIISVFALLLILGSCMTMKKSTDSAIYGNTWELEYLSGPRIAFAGLYPDKKPTITFNEATKKVEGNNSCNGYSAEYVMTGNQISFKDPGMTTMMFCGEGEKFFLNTMKKVNSYKIDAEGKLNLLTGDVPMMRFKKVN